MNLSNRTKIVIGAVADAVVVGWPGSRLPPAVTATATSTSALGRAPSSLSDDSGRCPLGEPRFVAWR
jgi:hypothetical protein